MASLPATTMQTAAPADLISGRQHRCPRSCAASSFGKSLLAACRCTAARLRSEGPQSCSGAPDLHRRHLLTSATAAVLAVISGQRCCRAADELVASGLEPSSSDQDIFETRDFYIRIPPSFQQAFDAPIPQERLGRGRAQPETPLKARFLSTEQGAQLTVVARESFQIKTTYFQCQDITQLGTVDQLAQKLLPPGARILSASSAEFTEPDRDLSVFQGFVTQPKQTIYRYEFENGGLHVTMAAAARVGRVFFAGGTAPVKGWEAAAPELEAAVGSFRLLSSQRNV